METAWIKLREGSAELKDSVWAATARVVPSSVPRELQSTLVLSDNQLPSIDKTIWSSQMMICR